MQARSLQPVLLVAIALTAASLATGCDEGNKSESQASNEKRPDGGEFPTPDFVLTPETKGALYTWIDKDGAFQLTENPSDVAEASRQTVRVVLDGHSPGGAQYVFVANLTALSPTKAIPLRTISRVEWESLGKAQRDERMAALQPAPVPKGESPADLGVDAIVYGADWCKPCHLAENYLKKKGAKVVKKDIEEDLNAAKEMRGKLKRAGMSGSSIPVLDVGGTVLRGFSERAIDAALKRAR